MILLWKNRRTQVLDRAGKFFTWL